MLVKLCYLTSIIYYVKRMEVVLLKLELMLKNNWINPMHTDCQGPDGKLGYGGACFPKDTQALNHYMKTYNSPNKVLESVCVEKNEVRD